MGTHTHTPDSTPLRAHSEKCSFAFLALLSRRNLGACYTRNEVANTTSHSTAREHTSHAHSQQRVFLLLRSCCCGHVAAAAVAHVAVAACC